MCLEKLAICQKTTTDNDKLILEHFVVISYEQSSAGEIVKEAGSDIIAKFRGIRPRMYIEDLL